MGLLLTDLRADFASTRLTPLASGLAALETAFAALGAQAEAWFAQEHIAPAARRLHRSVDMRYAGQNYELPIPLPPGGFGPATLAALAEGFAEAHQRMYGFVAPEEPVQLVTFRVEAIGGVRQAVLRPLPLTGPDAHGALADERQVWLPEAGGAVTVPVYARERLAPGNLLDGPAIIEQMDSTTVVLPGMTARVDAYDNLILEAMARE
jgi:N-methylhydantoinase A